MAKRYALIATDPITGKRKRIGMSTSKRELEGNASLARSIDTFTEFTVEEWSQLPQDEREK